MISFAKRAGILVAVALVLASVAGWFGGPDVGILGFRW
jgi:hypothetical protein